MVANRNPADAAAGERESTLAILVTTDRYLDHVVDLTTAAVGKGKRVSLFFTGRGVLLTLAPRFGELVGKAAVNICHYSFRAHGLDGRECDVRGVTAQNFVCQAKNAEMLSGADRHLVF